MKKIYIRFGEIPADEISKIHDGDLGVVGQELGVSVYEAIQGDKIEILMPSLTYNACVSLSGCIERNAYVVTGDVVGTGSDGEPVLRNVKIIEQVKLNKYHE